MSTVDTPGTLLGGRYLLLAPAGRGGMAEVWHAEVLGVAGFRRPVAIKRVLPHLSEAGPFREMFIEEARVTAALDHPNVVQVFDFGEDRAGLYLVMEWVEGVTLRELSEHRAQRGEPLSPALVAAIGIEVLRALEAAHSRRVLRAGALVDAPVIHRDVTPSNVLLSVRGVVKLTDFGLARALDRARMTPDDVVKGKLAYLAPELLQGQPASVLSDLYSCGVLLWELLAGRRLHDARADAEIVRALLSRTPHPPARAVRPDAPGALAEAIDRAIAVDPARRHESASAFTRALCDALRQIPERTDAARIAREVEVAAASRAVLPPSDTAVEIPVEYSDGTPHCVPIEAVEDASDTDATRGPVLPAAPSRGR